MTYPVFSAGEVLTAADMNAVSGWKTKTQTFSGATTVDVTSCFSSDYDNYRAIVRIKGAATAALYLRFLVGSTVQTDAIYSIEQRVQLTAGTLAIGTRTDSFALFGAVSTNFSNYQIEFSAPQISQITNFVMQGHFVRTATDADTFFDTGGNRVTTALNGFQLTTAGATNIDGTVRVYGYRN